MCVCVFVCVCKGDCVCQDVCSLVVTECMSAPAHRKEQSHCAFLIIPTSPAASEPLTLLQLKLMEGPDVCDNEFHFSLDGCYHSAVKMR